MKFKKEQVRAVMTAAWGSCAVGHDDRTPGNECLTIFSEILPCI
jgi:hypothetical protein